MPGRALVLYAGVGVEMLERRVAGVDQLQRSPLPEVLRGGPPDPAHAALEAAFAGDAPGVRDVLVTPDVPKRYVDRVERPVRQDRLVLQQAPPDAVGGRDGPDDGVASDDALVALVLGNVGIRVAEGDHVGAGPHPDEVVGSRAVHLEEPQVRLLPVDAVGALGVGRIVAAALEMHRRIVVAPVPDPVPVAILHEARAAGAGVPRAVAGDRDLSPFRAVEPALHALVFGDPVVVYE